MSESTVIYIKLIPKAASGIFICYTSGPYSQVYRSEDPLLGKGRQLQGRGYRRGQKLQELQQHWLRLRMLRGAEQQARLLLATVI